MYLFIAVSTLHSKELYWHTNHQGASYSCIAMKSHMILSEVTFAFIAAINLLQMHLYSAETYVWAAIYVKNNIFGG